MPPPKKEQFQIVVDNLQKQTDVDGGGDGRQVPVNMVYISEGYLTKDTGFTLFGSSEDEFCHSLFNYKKKNGTSYTIRGKGTKLQQYNYFDRTWSDIIDSPTFTAEAEFGYVVYNDDLYLGNAVESLYKWTGLVFTEYASAPKGNILEIFEDRLFVSGVTAEPLSTYYSNTSVPSTFTPADVIKPLGTDSITNLKNYYGSLLVFKQDSIWKITFVVELGSVIPKIESQSGTYGACSRKAVYWVENDIWFFTGTELRAIGFTDNVVGVFGINKSVISDPIKETLKLISVARYPKVVCFYDNRRFYLGIPLDADTVDVTFVCHTLYGNSWTKYSGRDKAETNDFIVIDGIIYTTTSSVPYGSLKWTVETADSESLSNAFVTES